MAATTYSNFGADTEATEVATAFESSIKDQTVLVTGVNLNGIGFSTSQAIVSTEAAATIYINNSQASKSPQCLIVTGRNPTKLSQCIDALKAEHPNVDYHSLQVDLSSQKSVRAAAGEMLSWTDVPKIDVIINSAGVMGIQQRTLSVDGIELHFATNHIGHFLLSCLLMPKLLKAAETNMKGATRIINVTSLSPTVSTMRWSDINFDKINKDLPEVEQPNYEWFKAWGYQEPENKAYVPLDGYDRSKVANLLFSVGLNNRLYDRGVLSVAVHPGVIQTELGRNFSAETKEVVGKLLEAGMFSIKTLGGGATSSLVAAFDPKLGTGRDNDPYLIDCQLSDKAQPLAVSNEEAEKLWKLSETLIGQEFAW